MTPYYDRGGITLYHADARDVLPALEPVGLMLTDPPYGIDGGRGNGNQQRGKGRYRSDFWDDTPDYICEVVVPLVRIGIALSDRAIVTPGSAQMYLYPKPDDIGCFWTPAASGWGKWGQIAFNPILYYGRDPRSGIGQSPNGRQLTEPPPKNGHPCPKPLNAWQWLLNKGSADPAEVILDPFVGSGTTLRAAKNLGHPAIGIEIDERFCEITVRYLEQEVLFW